MELRDRTVWITGASSGIGEALALELARAGAGVVLSARREDRLERTASACRAHGGRVAVLPLDLADPDRLAGSGARAEALLGPIDILVHAAGVGQRGTALATDMTVARRILEVDFWSGVTLCREILPSMLSRKRGQLVAVTGVLGKFGAPRRSFYSASKHALHGWLDSLREELIGTGVDVTLLVPGWVKTEISEHALEADGSSHGVMDEGQRQGITAEVCARRARPAIREGRAEQLIGGIECGAEYAQGQISWYRHRKRQTLRT